MPAAHRNVPGCLARVRASSEAAGYRLARVRMLARAAVFSAGGVAPPANMAR